MCGWTDGCDGQWGFYGVGVMWWERLWGLLCYVDVVEDEDYDITLGGGPIWHVGGKSALFDRFSLVIVSTKLSSMYFYVIHVDNGLFSS